MKSLTIEVQPLSCAVALGATLLLAGCDAGNHSDGNGGSSGATTTASSSTSASASATVASSSSSSSSSSGGVLLPALHVSGNQIMDSSNNVVQLRGVNRSGTEYSCVNSGAVFDGPVSPDSVAAIASWKTNVVRIPLNEDCWLGINGVAGPISGLAYQVQIKNYIQLLHAHNLYAIVDLHWNAPGTTKATAQQQVPDADHSPAFWTSVATYFKDDPGIIFDLYNEPILVSNNDAWNCLLNGCSIPAGGGINQAWQSAGMQALLDAVRGAGATQIVMVGGINWAGDLSQWMAHKPSDPLNNLAASVHVYDSAYCKSLSACWQPTLEPLAAQVPIIAGELGEKDCAHGTIDSFMSWADSKGVSYLAWAWNTANCSTFPALISNYDGTPTAFGQGYKDHLATLSP